jgi:hypothetical protein
MGSHTHAYQTFLFQEIDPINQRGHLRSFEWSRLFTPSPLELGESSHEGGEARFMVLIVEHVLCHPRREFFKGRSRKLARGRVCRPTPLMTSNLRRSVDILGKIIFEQGKVWGNPKIGFAEVDKNGDLKDGVRVEMDYFDLIVV